MKRSPLWGRKLLAALCLLSMSLSMSGCLSIAASFFLAAQDAAPIRSLGGYTDSVSYVYGEFQDYTIYEKYFFCSSSFTMETLSENAYFSPIRESDWGYINEHLDNFEGWVDSHARTDPSHRFVQNYDFDRRIIDPEDYFYIESKAMSGIDGQTILVDYDIYLFDTQSLVLYVLHSNI